MYWLGLKEELRLRHFITFCLLLLFFVLPLLLLLLLIIIIINIIINIIIIISIAIFLTMINSVQQVADFGLARDLTECEYYRKTGDGKVELMLN